MGPAWASAELGFCPEPQGWPCGGVGLAFLLQSGWSSWSPFRDEREMKTHHVTVCPPSPVGGGARGPGRGPHIAYWVGGQEGLGPVRALGPRWREPVVLLNCLKSGQILNFYD